MMLIYPVDKHVEGRFSGTAKKKEMCGEKLSQWVYLKTIVCSHFFSENVCSHLGVGKWKYMTIKGLFGLKGKWRNNIEIF